MIISFSVTVRMTLIMTKMISIRKLIIFRITMAMTMIMIILMMIKKDECDDD